MARKNLLFLFTDEQRADTLAAYGNERITMPHLDGLASRSTVFERAYVTQPVCTPSRASLLTGLYPHTHGSVLNNTPLARDTKCLPEMLEPNQWATGYMGKWHLGDEVFAQHGFEEWISIEDGYHAYFRPDREPETRTSYHDFLVENGFSPRNGKRFTRTEAAQLPEEWGKPAFLAREASRFIREHADEPFVLFVSFLEPHMPFCGPRDDQYAAEDVELPSNFDARPGPDFHLRSRLLQSIFEHDGYAGKPLRCEADWRALIARYWGLCSLIDTHVGTILETLAQCGLEDETIVVFTSDHGDLMGSHRLLTKSVMFEEAVRVPLLIRLPGQSAPQNIAEPVSHIDLMPTLLDLLDQPVPTHLPGRSRKAWLEGETIAQSSVDPVVVEWNLPPRTPDGRPLESGMDLLAVMAQGEYPDFLAAIASPDQALDAACDPIRSLITPDGWKFNWSARGAHELFDLNRDAGETTNLVGQPEHRERIAEMEKMIEQWQTRTGDSVRLADRRMAPE